jgi:LL-diaminopimelate aminotransferase
VERNDIYRQRRDIILSALDEAGIKADMPQASLYIWTDVPEGHTSAEFHSKLLEEAGISITPGSGFGKHGEGHMRISLGQSTERIEEAMSRLRKLMRGDLSAS